MLPEFHVTEFRGSGEDSPRTRTLFHRWFTLCRKPNIAVVREPDKTVDHDSY